MDYFAQDEYLKVDEVARLLRVSIRTVYRRIQSGELPAKKFGGLYYIRKSDLEAQLSAPLTAFPPASAIQPERVSSLKCGHCLRVLKSTAEIAKTCASEGCGALICQDCAKAGFEYCQRHQPSRAELWQAAESRFSKGEISFLVRDSAARAREALFLQRLRLRLNRVSTLLHPQSGDIVNISDWEALCEQGDQRTELLALLGRAFLDRETIESTPLNAWISYRLPPPHPKSLPILLTIQCLSHMEVFVRQGYDTQPLGMQDLMPHINRLLTPVPTQPRFHFVVLAATTGWDAEARRWLSGDQGMGGFIDPLALLYLYDLVKKELIFNPLAEKASHYAPLFNPLTEAEELHEVTEFIRKKVSLYDYLTLQEATQSLSFSPQLIEQAFKKLADSQEFSLLTLEGGEVAIVHKPVI